MKIQHQISLINTTLFFPCLFSSFDAIFNALTSCIIFVASSPFVATPPMSTQLLTLSLRKGKP